MKSVVALILACWVLGGSVLPGFGIDQSAHWGDLIQHYQQHRHDEPALSFLDFLKMHYGANSEHQKHPNHSHHNLPASCHSMPVYTPGTLRLTAPADFIQVLASTKSTYFRKADLYAYLAVVALINPPRR